MQLLELQGLWQHQVLRGLAARAAGNTVLWKGMATSIGQYAPVFLPGEPRLPDREAWQATVYKVAKNRTLPKRPCVRRCKTFLACGSSGPVRVAHEGCAAAWLAGTLAVPCIQGHELPLPQELWPYQSFFEGLVAGDQNTSGQSVSVAQPIQALRGLPCLGSFSVWRVRHIEGPSAGVLLCKSVHPSLKGAPWVGSCSRFSASVT